MARISTYIIDTAVSLLDKWIGTDSTGGATKNFTSQSVATLFNEHSSIGIVGQNNFRFQANGTGGRLQGTLSFDDFGGDGSNFSGITTIKISKYASSNNIILEYLQTLVNQYVAIAQIDNLNNFGIYKLNSLEQDIDEPNFYNASFTLREANGTISDNEYYGLAVYPVYEEDLKDLNFIYTQVSAASVWSITHNLGKFPSVSVTDSADNLVIGDVRYIDENQLIIDFTASFSGKAYLN